MATSDDGQRAITLQQFAAGLSDEERAKIIEMYVSSVFQAAVDRGLPSYEAMPAEHSHRLFLWMAERLTDSIVDPDKLDVDQAARELLHYYGRMLLEPWRDKLNAPTMPTVQDDQALAGAVEVSQAPQADQAPAGAVEVPQAPAASVEVPQVTQNAGDNPLGLTGRLKEIADLVAQGLQRKEIAGQLVIGVGTVNDYAHDIAQMVEEHTGQPVKAHTLGTRLTSLGYGPATLP